MHPRILAQRNADAQASIKRSIAALAGAHGFAAVDIFQPVKANDPAVRELYEREAVASFLELLAGATGSAPAPVLSTPVETTSQPAEVFEVERPTSVLDPLPPLIRKALTAAGFETGNQVEAASDEQLLAVKGVAAKALTIIRDQFPHTPARSEA